MAMGGQGGREHGWVASHSRVLPPPFDLVVTTAASCRVGERSTAMLDVVNKAGYLDHLSSPPVILSTMAAAFCCSFRCIPTTTIAAASCRVCAGCLPVRL